MSNTQCRLLILADTLDATSSQLLYREWTESQVRQALQKIGRGEKVSYDEHVMGWGFFHSKKAG